MGNVVMVRKKSLEMEKGNVSPPDVRNPVGPLDSRHEGTYSEKTSHTEEKALFTCSGTSFGQKILEESHRWNIEDVVAASSGSITVRGPVSLCAARETES
jgi:hypothetical protein